MQKQKAICCDLDGTMCLFNGRGPYDEYKVHTDVPNVPVLNTVLAMRDAGYAIIFVSGRHESCRDATRDWLDEYVSAPYTLCMRPNPIKGQNEEKDAIVKERIYREDIEPYHDVLYVLDDRRQVIEMWRSIGLTCFQVAPSPD